MGDKFRGSDRVSVAFFGDATVEEGVFHECANFASLHKLPVIFVCENNFFSIYSPIEQRQPARPIAKLGEAHGIPSVSADGNDVLAVRAIAADAVRRARAGQGPGFLVFDTFRWHEHCGPSVDDHLGYRANHDVEAWRARCPIQKLERDLGGRGIMSAADIAQVRKNLDLEIEDAFAFARNAPLPAPSLANLYVYA
jgi:pyruvate dehydrogenase E1 component alpha subunit